MEGRNYYAAQFSSKNAKNEQEMNAIAICNAAAIGVVKGLNKYMPSYLSKEDIEDAIIDAQINALERIDPNRIGGKSYANACGFSSAVKTCKAITRDNSRFSRLDICGEDGEWYQDSSISVKHGGYDTDAFEAERCKSEKDRIIMESYLALSDKDRMVIEFRKNGASSTEIAAALGCSTGAALKRAHDIASRYDKLLKKNGYYDLS